MTKGKNLMDPFSFDHLDAQFPNFAFSPLPLDPIPIVASAFVPYVGGPKDELAFADPNCQSGSNQNIHRRVIDLLRTTAPNADGQQNQEAKQRRRLRHVMRERERRERLSQSYADLHSMLVPRAKVDKVSIVRSATTYLRQLKEAKEGLEKRSDELEASIAREVEAGEGREVIKVHKGNTASSVNSVIAALTCLKGMDAKATSILFHVTGQNLSAVMGVQRMKMAKCEVERALETTLTDIEDTSHAICVHGRRD